MNERSLLRIFYAVATTLKMTAAAERLYISQPAISQTIQELEAKLGVRLFDRIGKRIFLTYAGELFLDYTRRILNLYEECLEKMQAIEALESGRIAVGASTTIGIYMLTDITGKFRKSHPRIDVLIQIENTKILEGLLLGNRIDFAFAEGVTSSPEIASEPFWDDELVIVVRGDHPWLEKERITAADLAQEKFIMREPGSGTRQIIETAFKIHGVTYQPGLELGNTEAIKKAVEAGLGIACVSARCIQNELAEGRLAVVVVAGLRITRPLHLIYHKDKRLTDLAKLFIGFCRG